MVASYSFPARRSMPAPIWARSRLRWRTRNSADDPGRRTIGSQATALRGGRSMRGRTRSAMNCPWPVSSRRSSRRNNQCPTEVHLRRAGLSVRHRVAESSTLIYGRRGDAGRHGPSRPSPHVVGDLREVGGQIQAAPKLVLNHRISLLSPQCGGTLVPKTRENRRKKKCPT